MNLTIVYSIHPILDDGTITEWKSNHEYDTFISLDGIPVPEVGLFSPPTSILVYVDSFTVAQVERIQKEFPEDCDILIVSKKKSSAKSIEKNATVVDLLPPKRDNEFAKMLSKKLGISANTASYCVRKSSTPLSAIIMSQQASYSVNKSPTTMVDIGRGDSPPWGVTNAITSGNCCEAIREARLLFKQGVKPSNFLFQLLGYMRKVVASGNDSAHFIDGNSSNFRRSYSNIKDINGLAKDMSQYPEKVLSKSSTSELMMICFIASMASRFK